MVYEPQEDSYLLQKFVREHAFGVVLDMGTGSGIQAIEAAKSRKTKKVFGVDVNSKALIWVKEKYSPKKYKKIVWLQSDLFSAFHAKKWRHAFDTIIFNAPYLPYGEFEPDIALEGGKQGHEVIEKFISSVNNYLKLGGKILLVFSSATPYIFEILEKNLLFGRELGKVHVFFEDIFVYEITQSNALLELHKQGVHNVEFFARGKRGLVFTGDYRGKKVAIKVKRPGSDSLNVVHLEATMLKTVNKKKIGPKYLFHNPELIVYEFAKGTYLRDLPKNKVKKACKEILRQSRVLDKMQVNKQEMTRPYKHAIIDGKKVTLIDFERARKTPDPHNVTQFCQYIGNHVGNKKTWVQLATLYHLEPERAYKLMQKEL